MGTHDNNFRGSLLQTDTPPYRIAATDWLLQISFITSTMKFHSDVSTDNRSKRFLCFISWFIICEPSVFSVCLNKRGLETDDLFIRNTFLFILFPPISRESKKLSERNNSLHSSRHLSSFSFSPS